MKRLVGCIISVMCVVALNAQVLLRNLGERAFLEVDGQPMLILGGELSNSAATCIQDIDKVMPQMKAAGLNTVLVPAQWDLIEPEEGHYDFSLIDTTIFRARENGLKVIFLWFGAWKNSMSCYAPLWFKENVKRFPRAMTHQGKPLEIASAFSENVFEADNRVFASFMQHIKEIDGKEHTVIMIQVENEIGMLEDARDHSPLAQKAYNELIPGKLRKVLGINSAVKWSDVISADQYTGDEVLAFHEQFMAWHYACYVERLALTAKHIYDIPLYVNAAMNSRGRKPGEYPSAGPLAHLADIWKLGAPHISFLAPDIYDTGFKGWAQKYDMGKKNPLFIPESKCCVNSGVRAIYVFGEHEGIGFSPFAIDRGTDAELGQVSQAYSMLKELSPLLLKYRGKNMIRGVLFDQDDKETVIEEDDRILTCWHYFTLPWDARATDGSIWREGGAVIIRLNNNEYIIAGSGVVVTFQTKTEHRQTENQRLGEDGFAESGSGQGRNVASPVFSGKRIGIGTVDEVHVEPDGTLVYQRRLNGDEDHQGRHVRIGIDDYQILHVRLYEY